MTLTCHISVVKSTIESRHTNKKKKWPIDQGDHMLPLHNVKE